MSMAVMITLDGAERKELMWKLVIIRSENGYIVKGNDTDIVIEDNTSKPLDSGEHLLWEVMHYFNFGGTKHDEERLRITREKQT